MCVCGGGVYATSISPQLPRRRLFMWLADHGTSGPEVVLAVGVAPSRRWAEKWYGLVVAVAPCPVSV